MEELRKFSPEVCAELKHYVYRLINPRNWMTFYVGKRKIIEYLYLRSAHWKIMEMLITTKNKTMKKI